MHQFAPSKPETDGPHHPVKGTLFQFSMQWAHLTSNFHQSGLLIMATSRPHAKKQEPVFHEKAGVDSGATIR
tara:strand:+ start:321 stop:536 length:216 start_codon:yes stop_codon:yes gene_type:complete